ncbi:MAG: 50S ribosomal protein L5 [Myxococcota bacterium]
MSEYESRLKKKYKEEVVPQLMKDFDFANIMQVPKVERVVVNMGLGEAVQNAKIVESAVAELTSITGRKPVVTRAKKSIAGFKLREGMPIGVMVTLRGEAMYDFIDRLVSLALPRTRDFKGTSRKAFDGRGNYTLGIKEQIIFPEINYDKIDRIKGMNVTFVTTAENDDQGRALLKQLGMPFRN